MSELTNPSGKKAVLVNNLSSGYNGKIVIRDIELSVEEGEIVTLIGPNGAGKSTLLKTMARQLAPVMGTVMIEGSDLKNLSFRELSRTISVLLTERIDPELMTVCDVVESGRHPYTGSFGILKPEDHEIVEDAMELCDIVSIKNRYFRELSDGQKQRVMLARTIAQQPKVMILDEPTSYMDIRYKLDLLKLLKKLRDRNNITIIMSLHEFELAKFVSDRIVCVKDDKIYKVGAPSEILNREVLSGLFGISNENMEMLLQVVSLMV